MLYRLLGRSGLRVSEICLGAMVFGDQRGSGARRLRPRPQSSSGTPRRGDFIDAANHYAGGESERIVGDPIRPDRDRWEAVAWCASCAPVKRETNGLLRTSTDFHGLSAAVLKPPVPVPTRLPEQEPLG
jgi:aryl-alcohol dehydrogenase-like predicted oxidoreductase